jgi:hypothetical protein
MVIVRLTCGLGNQLFQYAAARRIAHINNTQLKIDISPFANYNLHSYSLNAFNIIEEFASIDEVKKLQYPSGIIGKWQRLVASSYPYYLRKNIEEKFFHFDPNILEVRSPVYLVGHWQSELYFKEIEHIIRKEFTIKLKPCPTNEQTASLIGRVNAVSVHVRRADYVDNPETMKFHGACPLLYYQQAVQLIARKVTNPHFFIFSDDILWAKRNFSFSYPTVFVSQNDPSKNFEDLRLMSKCRHHIIANSTFSWWGAWLNEERNKIVIAPKKWFNDESIDTKDLIPKGWLRV